MEITVPETAGQSASYRFRRIQLRQIGTAWRTPRRQTLRPRPGREPTGVDGLFGWVKGEERSQPYSARERLRLTRSRIVAAIPAGLSIPLIRMKRLPA